jgi:hypothetical protein
VGSCVSEASLAGASQNTQTERTPRQAASQSRISGQRAAATGNFGEKRARSRRLPQRFSRRAFYKAEHRADEVRKKTSLAFSARLVWKRYIERVRLAQAVAPRGIIVTEAQ